MGAVWDHLFYSDADLWQHRTRFVAGTRWWPPFCAAVDFLVAAILAVGVAYGMSFH